MTLSAVVVGHGDEPLLAACLEALVAQLRRDDEVVLVDHGITSVPVVDGVRLVTPATNTGFGGGCEVGAREARGDVLVFVNSDAIVEPGAVAAIAEAVADESVGLAGGLVLLAAQPGHVDSAGLPVHLTGLSWCGGYGDPVARHRTPRSVTSIHGAFFGCRREVWDLLGGMDVEYFMYHEDTDLSLRTHLAGLRCILVPDAVATHDHDFSRNARKMFLLERNRFLTVLGDYPSHLLLRVLPVLLVLEPAYLLIAARDGWAAEKLRAWSWIVRHAPDVRARRRRVQAATIAPHALDDLLVPAVTQTQLEAPAAMGALNALLSAYWRVAGPRGRTTR
ncbi:glycosyltransferase family 2 protein [Oryzobacter terrae]|uniref:glycosyltransferase family 2 protein n=1 Tax=Oryzobacter terrae TaxID=1620385 RepID=UPI00366AB1E7